MEGIKLPAALTLLLLLRADLRGAAEREGERLRTQRSHTPSSDSP
jgi:hypothetical protein